jgi:hypothetical protein
MIGNDFSSNGELQITIREKKIIRQKRKKKIQAIQTNTGSRIQYIFSLMVICNSPLLLKSLPIIVINCNKFYFNCSALTGGYD